MCIHVYLDVYVCECVCVGACMCVYVVRGYVIACEIRRGSEPLLYMNGIDVLKSALPSSATAVDLDNPCYNHAYYCVVWVCILL